MPSIEEMCLSRSAPQNSMVREWAVSAVEAIENEEQREERRLHGYEVSSSEEEEDDDEGSAGGGGSCEDDDDAVSQLSSSVPHRYKGVLKVSVLNERPGGAFGSGSTDGDADGSEGPGDSPPPPRHNQSKIRSAAVVLGEMCRLTAADFVRLQIADRSSQSLDGSLRHPDSSRFAGAVQTAAARFNKPPGRHPFPGLYNGWVAEYIKG